MPHQYVALLRAISNVPMLPFREALQELGYNDVESYGMSGNLLFNAPGRDAASLERDIAKRLGIVTILRTRAEITRVVALNPLRDYSDAAVLFLKAAPAPTRRRTFNEREYEGDQPVLRGKTLFYRYPVRLRGKRSPFDVERALGVQGTFRTARVVTRLLELMR